MMQFEKKEHRHQYLSDLEYNFRKILYKWQMGDDTVITPWISLPVTLKLESEHFWGVPVKHVSTKDDSVSLTAWRYDPPLKNEDDIELITPPQYRYDAVATDRDLNRMAELLGNIMPVRLSCGFPTRPSVAWLHGWAAQLRGVEALMMDLMDRPEWVHLLMSKLLEGILSLINCIEQMGVLTLENHSTLDCDDLPREAAGAFCPAISGSGPKARNFTAYRRNCIGCCIQIVLQELETLNGNPRRLFDWVNLAKETGANLN